MVDGSIDGVIEGLREKLPTYGRDLAIDASDMPAYANGQGYVSKNSGREDDLRTHPDHPNACHWRANAAADGRMIEGINSGGVVPDAKVRRLVRQLAEASDREEEYERVVFEQMRWPPCGSRSERAAEGRRRCLRKPLRSQSRPTVATGVGHS